MGADAAVEEQFGPYLVYERLGVGGMATVHRALERGIEGFERVVALKRLLPHLAADASFIKSFVREAKLASLLNHVNIVQIFECGRVGAQYFISMEYIDGRDIRQILRHARKVSGPPPIHVTVGLLLQLCDALDYAHHKVDDTGQALGLVHRDVSPSNVLVTSAGHVKVIDFGIAKAQSAQLRTQTGRVKGKLAYMAPETLAGKDLDARSDLFAAGIIGHELLTARPLFATKNDYQTLLKVQRGEIARPSAYNPHCPPELDAIVLRALARDPDERFRHASDLRDALHELRKQYQLQTSDRDVATWLGWAFTLEAPSSGHRPSARAPSKTELDVEPLPQDRPSRPRRNDDDEVMEIAWGGGDDHQGGEPIVLDDVPDVSDKHLASASSLGAEVRLDLDDLADDIPTPLPSHGARASADTSYRAVAASLYTRPVARAHRPTPALPTLPVRTSAPVATAAHAAHGGGATPSAATGPGVRSGMMPPRARTITIPPRLVPSVSSAPRTAPSLSPPPGASGSPASATPPRNAPSGSTPPRDVALGSVSRGALGTTPLPTMPAAAWPPDRLATALGIGTRRADTATVESAPSFAAAEPSMYPDTVTERTPFMSVEDPGLAADTMPSMPATRPTEPIVRFREPTPAPPNAASASSPAPASLPSPAPNLPAPRLVTPATALFAEPEIDPELDTATDQPPREPAVETAEPGRDPAGGTGAPVDGASRRRVTLRRVLVIAVALAGLAAASTAAVLYLLPSAAPVTEPRPPAPPPRNKTVATVELTVVPADAAITIEGQPVHVGSPWTVDLAPGVYQIGINHVGYIAWLTSIDLVPGENQLVQVTLEPIGATVVVDATLIVGSTPSALEVVLDGAPSTARTPIKLPIQPGSHTIVLRMNGVEVWKRTLNAWAGQTYEFHPKIVAPADRLRQTATPDQREPAPADPPVDPGPDQPPRPAPAEVPPEAK